MKQEKGNKVTNPYYLAYLNHIKKLRKKKQIMAL